MAKQTPRFRLHGRAHWHTGDGTVVRACCVEPVAEARQQDGSALHERHDPSDSVDWGCTCGARGSHGWHGFSRHLQGVLAALPPSAPECSDPEHPNGAYCRNTTGLPACYVPPSAPPALDVEGWAQVVHDATPVQLDGGVPDVCNRWMEHEAVARAVLARLQEPER